MYGPYLLGAVYAVSALPVFSQLCGQSGNPISFVRDPINYSDYRMFLYGSGCKYVPAGAGDTQMMPITPEYHGMHQRFSDDVVGYLFENVGHYWKHVFLVGTTWTGYTVIAALQTNVMVRALFYIGYLLVVAVIFILLSKTVDNVWQHFHGG